MSGAQRCCVGVGPSSLEQVSDPVSASEHPAAGTVIQAYRFLLEPTVTQADALRSHRGAQRFAYNWGLARVIADLDQRHAEATYGLSSEDLTDPLSWSAYSLRKDWNQVKHTVAPWWPENAKEAYSSGLANLATALKKWDESQSGGGKGRKSGFPKFKSKRSRCSCRFTTGNLGLTDADRRHVRLPRIGIVRTGESTRKLARHVERGSARIRSATVSFAGGRWFVTFSVEIVRADMRATSPDRVVGVDLGVKVLAVLSQPVPGISNGQGLVANPRHFDRSRCELRRLQRRAARRRGPDDRAGTKPSKRWRRANARITRLQAMIANSRRDSLHKLTTALIASSTTVVVENLNVAGMLRNRRLARHIADVGFGEIRRQLTYKSLWYGGTLVVADRWYPSSETCSNCGVVKAKLRLSDRLFVCDECGYVLDRDVNAARNLAALVLSVEGGASAASCVGTKNTLAGNPCKTLTVRATGTATSRPVLGAGQPCRGNSAGRETLPYVSRTALP
ncbi:transposase [Nocardia seriolae]|nr:IS607 family element RNA-guided endonuclease TnpB [Nocardia seriolae]GAM50669.1 transposase [Nocardia seriolae]